MFTTTHPLRRQGYRKKMVNAPTTVQSTNRPTASAASLGGSGTNFRSTVLSCRHTNSESMTGHCIHATEPNPHRHSNMLLCFMSFPSHVT